MSEALWLVKNGIPFDVAFSLDDETRAAWSIRLGLFDGGQFDWEEGRFKDPAENG